MTKIAFSILGILVAAKIAIAAQQDHRFVRKFQFPAGREFAVVAEGVIEPRSIGSYSVRIYSGLSSKFPFDDFVAGIVMPRDGAVEDVKFHDLDGDGRPEVVVIVRSVGSGGYLSADAFRYRTRSLEFAVSVSDLDKRADPIQALRDKLKVPAENRTPPHPENRQR